VELVVVSERPYQQLGNQHLLELGIQAVEAFDGKTVALLRAELESRSSKSAVKALKKLNAAHSAQTKERMLQAQGRNLDANPPCLYAILLEANPKKAMLYVGSSGVHTARCKASIHIDGICICGRTKDPNPYQRRPVPKGHGIRLYDCRSLPEGTEEDPRVVAEKQWAQELAVQFGIGVWCDGKLYT